MATKTLRGPGSKSYFAKWIHAMAPLSCLEAEGGYTHRLIGCCGTLGEFIKWEPYDGISEVINDKNGEIFNFWDVVRIPKLHAMLDDALKCTQPVSEEEWEACREVRVIGKSDAARVEEARRFFIRMRNCRQGACKSYLTPTTRRRRGINEHVSATLSAIEGLADVGNRLKFVETRNMDLIQFIDAYDQENGFFYIDVPYHPETRVTTDDYGDFEMTKEYHEEILLPRLAAGRMRGKFALSGYWHQSYEDWAQENGYARYELAVTASSSAKKSKEKRVESLWVNYEMPYREEQAKYYPDEA